MKETMFDAVIFDMDGLLLDTERLAIDAGTAAIAARGYDIAPDFMLTLVGIDSREGHRRLTAHLGVDWAFELFNDEWTARYRGLMAQEGIPVKPGVHDLLTQLQAAGLPLAVATNSRTDNAETYLGSAGLRGWFNQVVGYDSVARAKPAPDVYLAAAKGLGVAPARCLAFDDSDTGVRAAMAAGMTVVQVPDLRPSSENRAHFSAGTLLDGAMACGLLTQFD